MKDDQPAVAKHAHLALELVTEVGGGFLGGNSVGHVRGEPAVLDHQIREGQVVAEARIDEDVGVAAHGIDRAIATRHRAHLRFPPAQGNLKAPVRALAVGAVGA